MGEWTAFLRMKLCMTFINLCIVVIAPPPTNLNNNKKCIVLHTNSIEITIEKNLSKFKGKYVTTTAVIATL